MIRLLLETATDVCSVAVARGETILAEHTATEVHQHSSHLTLFIQQVMQEAGLRMTDLEEIVLSDGPGSYTSLRVGAATAKGLCVALPALQLRVVSTLLSLALSAPPHDEPTLATINSRKGEVYAQLFDFRARPPVQSEGKKQGIDGLRPLLLGPQNLRLTENEWLMEVAVAANSEYFQICGPGQQRVSDALAATNDGPNVGFAEPQHCSARLLLAPATAPEYSRLVDMASYEPLYLNPPFVTKSRKKLLGR
jgi:tRNA threonylcarbamoyladenosine biosynthesis protein TsaB